MIKFWIRIFLTVCRNDLLKYWIGKVRKKTSEIILINFCEIERKGGVAILKSHSKLIF